MYSCETLHMDEQRQESQNEPTYSNSVSIQDVVLKICRKQWMIGRGGEKVSGISVLMVWHEDDDDDDEIYFEIVNAFDSRDRLLSHHHHHHIVLAARISLTLSRHSSLSFIALGRSSGQQPVSSHSCWMYVRAGRPAMLFHQSSTQVNLKANPNMCNIKEANTPFYWVSLVPSLMYIYVRFIF